MPGIFDPLWKGPSRFAKRVADSIDNPEGEGGYIRGGLAGMAQGAGDVLSDMTSPFSIATSAIPVASKLGLIGKAISALSPEAMLSASRAARYANMAGEDTSLGGNAIWNDALGGENVAQKLAKGREVVDDAVSMSRGRAIPNAKVTRVGSMHNSPHMGDFGADVYKISSPGTSLDNAEVTAEGLKRLGLQVPSSSGVSPIGPSVDLGSMLDRDANMAANRLRSSRLKPSKFNPEMDY